MRIRMWWMGEWLDGRMAGGLYFKKGVIMASYLSLLVAVEFFGWWNYFEL